MAKGFFIDAQLPSILKQLFLEFGIIAFHTKDLPDKNKTKDQNIILFADSKDLAIITKNSDFFYSQLRHGHPKKLVLVKFGNLSLEETISYFKENIKRINSEIRHKNLIILEKRNNTK